MIEVWAVGPEKVEDEEEQVSLEHTGCYYCFSRRRNLQSRFYTLAN